MMISLETRVLQIKRQGGGRKERRTIRVEILVARLAGAYGKRPAGIASAPGGVWTGRPALLCQRSDPYLINKNDLLINNNL
jgi:hypothetical protein